MLEAAEKKVESVNLLENSDTNKPPATINAKKSDEDIPGEDLPPNQNQVHNGKYEPKAKHFSFDLPLQSGWIREVAERSRATSGLASQHQPLPQRANSTPCSRIIRREYVFYCTSRAMVPGILSISECVVTFEPDKRGLAVRQQGLGEFQVVIPLCEVSEAAAVILPRTRAIDNLFFLPTEKLMDVPHWLHSASEISSPSSLNTQSNETLSQEPSIGLLQILLKEQARHHPNRQSKQSPQKSSVKTQTDLNKNWPSVPLNQVHGGFPSNPLPIGHGFLSEGSGLAGLRHEKAISSYEPTPTGRLLSNELKNGKDFDLRPPKSAELFPYPCQGTTSTISRRTSASRIGDVTAIVTDRPKRKERSSTMEAIHLESKGSGELQLNTDCDCLPNSTPVIGTSERVQKTQPKKALTTFVMFRLSSAPVVKEVTRIILNLLDSLSESENGEPSGQGSAFVPHLSNTSLNTLMSLCLNDVEEDALYYSQTEPFHQGERLKSSITTFSDYKEHVTSEWLLRPSPPKLKVPSGVDSMLNDHMSLQLAAALPPTIALRRWEVLFDTSYHGVSLLSFYRHIEGRSPAFILIRDNKDYVFGGYSPEGFFESRHYYGTGEAFVFTFGKALDNDGSRFHISELDDPFSDKHAEKVDNPELKVFSWSGRDNHFIYSDLERIIFGGGGRFALALDHDLLQGNTGICPTYGNELLSESDDFAVKRIQVWGFEKL